MIRDIVVSDPQIMDGTPVFAGTNVRVETFLHYHAGEVPVYEFLIDHPSVEPEQAKRLARWLAAQEPATVRAKLEQFRMTLHHANR